MKSQKSFKNLSAKEHKRAETELPNILSPISCQNFSSNRFVHLYPTALNCDRLPIESSSTGSIGPGYYNFSSTLGGPSFIFSSIQRFSSRNPSTYTPILEKINFTQKNKDLDQHLPQNKQKLQNFHENKQSLKMKHKFVSIDSRHVFNSEKRC